MNRSAILMLILITGCDFSAVKDFGEACGATDDCGEDGECVIVDDDVAHCLPRPTARQERSCSVDDDCTLSDGQLWPIETECLDGACRCLGAEILCTAADEGDGDDFSVVLEEETCRCVPRGNEGDACITSHTCDVDLACTGGECRSAPGEAGAACFTGDCGEGLTCSEFRDNNEVGVCR